MLYLIGCILSSTGIFIVFKSIDRLRIPSFPVILINYLAATLLGFLINPIQAEGSSILQMDWLPLSIIIGIMFILMFFLIAFSSSKAGISVTTVASKMSVIFPIAFSLLIEPSDRLSPIKALAILTAVAGVGLTVYRPATGTLDRRSILIPLLLFVGMGLVDSLVKFAQHRFVSDDQTALFSAILFLNAFLSGVLILLFRRRYLRQLGKPRTWGWGVLLGSVNFGSIYFLVRALNHITPYGGSLDSSMVFGVNNIGIVALSVLVGLVGFREQLTIINWLGITLSAVALSLFALNG